MLYSQGCTQCDMLSQKKNETSIWSILQAGAVIFVAVSVYVIFMNKNSERRLESLYCTQHIWSISFSSLYLCHVRYSLPIKKLLTNCSHSPSLTAHYHYISPLRSLLAIPCIRQWRLLDSRMQAISIYKKQKQTSFWCMGSVESDVTQTTMCCTRSEQEEKKKIW